MINADVDVSDPETASLFLARFKCQDPCMFPPEMGSLKAAWGMSGNYSIQMYANSLFWISGWFSVKETLTRLGSF